MASVFDLDSQNPVAEVTWLPVWPEARAIAQAAAIRISRAVSTDYLLITAPVATASPSGHADRVIWRIGALETDARMLFYSSTPGRPVSRLALVDGSIVRAAGSGGFQLDLHRVVPDYFGSPAPSTQHPAPSTQH